MRDSKRLRRLRRYCYKRYLKAQTRRASIFWSIAHFRFGKLLEKEVKGEIKGISE